MDPTIDETKQFSCLVINPGVGTGGVEDASEALSLLQADWRFERRLAVQVNCAPGAAQHAEAVLLRRPGHERSLLIT